jgi:hypothetical protein
MTITFQSTYPVNGATQVSTSIATTSLQAITFTLFTNDPPINSSTLNVSINGVAVISSGITQASIYFPVVTLGATTITVAITFVNPLQTFNSFETVVVKTSASDSTSFNSSFSFRIIETTYPVISEIAPANGSLDNAPNTPIFFQITDQGSGVLPATLIVSLNITQNMIITGENAILLGVIQPGYTGSITTLGTTLDVFLTRTVEFDSNAAVTVAIQGQNEANVVNGSFQFEILDVSPPTLSNFIPAKDSVNISESSTVSLTISDNNGSGINLSTLNVTLNGTYAIRNGIKQFPFLLPSSQILLSPSPANIQTAILVLNATDDFPAAQFVQVYVSAKDSRSNQTNLHYSFRVRDNKPPQIVNMLPGDGYVNILPTTPITFSIVEEYDGYAVDFTNLTIQVDGYDVLNQLYNNIPADGYWDSYVGITFTNPVFNVDGYYFTPPIQDAYGLQYPGFLTTIYHLPSTTSYNFIVQPLNPFAFNDSISVKIDVLDVGGNTESLTYFFQTAQLGQIITTAFPSTGTYKNFIDGYGLKEAYKFLYQTGVTLTANLPNTRTYYSTDGTVPKVDRFGNVIGTTQVYTKPILINRQGLNIIKFFSIDEAGNRESLEQEVYMIDIIPPEINVVTSVPIYTDIPYPTTIIPLQLAADGYSTHSTDLFRAGELVKILDDAVPPVLTTILAINSSSNPPFLIVQDPVRKLKVSRNARVEIATQLIDPAQAIDFDVTSVPKSTYIGSDGLGVNQADAVIDQFRILNVASTDQEILADYTLLTKGTSFFNQLGPITLPSNYSVLETSRANLPNNTLVLLEFNGTIQNAPRQQLLANNSTPIVDTTLASNTIIFTISIPAGQFVDRELLTTVLTNFAPTDLQVVVKFIDL